MANLTDADKVIRNDVGKTIASKLDDIADAIVQQGGGAHSLGQLSDVDIDTTTLAEGQSIVYNPTTQKFENGEVSTVAALDDLTDVSITSAQKGDSLRNDGNGNWVNEPTTVTMTLAEWNAMSTAEQTAWINSHKNTRLIISDAPNLNETSKQISYDGGTDTVWDKVEEVKTNKQDKITVVTTVSGSTDNTGNIVVPDISPSTHMLLSAYKDRTLPNTDIAMASLGVNASQTAYLVHLALTDGTAYANKSNVVLKIAYIKL